MNEMDQNAKYLRPILRSYCQSKNTVHDVIHRDGTYRGILHLAFIRILVQATTSKMCPTIDEEREEKTMVRTTAADDVIRRVFRCANFC